MLPVTKPRGGAVRGGGRVHPPALDKVLPPGAVLEMAHRGRPDLPPGSRSGGGGHMG